jgi:hypothetical protein
MFTKNMKPYNSVYYNKIISKSLFSLPQRLKGRFPYWKEFIALFSFVAGQAFKRFPDANVCVWGGGGQA